MGKFFLGWCDPVSGIIACPGLSLLLNCPMIGLWRQIDQVRAILLHVHQTSEVWGMCRFGRWGSWIGTMLILRSVGRESWSMRWCTGTASFDWWKSSGNDGVKVTSAGECSVILCSGMKIFPKEIFQILYEVKYGSIGESWGLPVIFLCPKVLEVAA